MLLILAYDLLFICVAEAVSLSVTILPVSTDGSIDVLPSHLLRAAMASSGIPNGSLLLINLLSQVLLKRRWGTIPLWWRCGFASSADLRHVDGRACYRMLCLLQ